MEKKKKVFKSCLRFSTQIKLVIKAVAVSRLVILNVMVRKILLPSLKGLSLTWSPKTQK